MTHDALIIRRNLHLETGVVSELVLNRPDKGNALTLDMLLQLRALIEELSADRDVRVVLLRGAGKFFCTGGDIKDWGAMAPQEMAEEWILPGIEIFNALAALPQPVVAVLQGHVFGGGLELALAADLRIAAPGIKLGTPEVRLGMVAGWGGVRRLAETVGVSRARYLALTGTPISSETALEWGLVHAVASSPDVLEQEVQSMVEAILKNAPIAMSVTKGLLATMHADLRYAHASAVAQVSSTQDCKEGVMAFREKRPAHFQNK